jgi:deoxyribonuclease V
MSGADAAAWSTTWLPGPGQHCHDGSSKTPRAVKRQAVAVQIHPLHSWNLTPTEAVALQRELASRVDVRTPITRCELIAGADVSYNRFSTTFFASVVVLRFDDCSIVETQGAVQEVTFPYVPGLLSFREAPVLLEAFAKVQTEPDAIMLDGQGIAHPRRLGLASHIGLWLNRPCLGCAKSRLTGRYKEPARKAGSLSQLMDGGEVIGDVVRTKDAVQPAFVSAGHRIDLSSAVRLVLATCRGYRIPEPTRQAHLHVNAFRRQAGR